MRKVVFDRNKVVVSDIVGDLSGQLGKEKMGYGTLWLLRNLQVG